MNHHDRTRQKSSLGYLSSMRLLNPGIYQGASEEVRRLVRQELNDGLFEAVRVGAIGSMVFSTFLAAVLLRSQSATGVILWYLGVNLLSVARYWLTRRYFTTNPCFDRLGLWRQGLLILTALVGVAWSSLVYLIWDSQDLLATTYAIFSLSVLAGSAYATLGTYIKALSTTLFFPFAALAIFFAHRMSGIWVFAEIVIVTFFASAMLMASRNASLQFRNTLTLMYQNQELMRNFEEKSALLSTTLSVIADGVITTDEQGVVSYINPAAEAMTGVSREAAQGVPAASMLHIRDDSNNGSQVDLAGLLQGANGTIGKLAGELVLVTERAEDVPINATLSDLRAAGASAAGFVLSLHDVTSLRRLTRDLSFKALHDPLTGLLNRRGFETRLDEALANSRIHTQKNCLCLLDLDHFKQINDTCGHQAGDEVLQQVVTLIRQWIRDSDSFSRLGGDEFAITLYGCSLERAKTITQNIILAVQQYRYCWQGKAYGIGVSIGLTQFKASDTRESLLQAADTACYRAKADGRGQVATVVR